MTQFPRTQNRGRPSAPVLPPKTLKELSGAPSGLAPLSEHVLLAIDIQREYIDGALRLTGVDRAMREANAILGRARAVGTPVVHVMHRGNGPLFNPAGPYFAMAKPLAPEAQELVLEKKLPNAFAGTGLHEALEKIGGRRLLLIGFMTHMCVSSTARAALDLGYATTVIASATATRDLPDGSGGIVPAAVVQRASLAALADRFATVVGQPAEVPD